MPYLIEIDFEERPGDETIVHRVRNFGEDLWRKLHTGDQAKIDLNAVDAATTRLELTLAAPQHRDHVIRIISTILDQHYLAHLARISEKLIVKRSERSNQALERTATRCVFTLQMIKTVSLQATLALGGGRSSWSR